MDRAKRTADGQIMFWCPGCEEHHAVPVEGSSAQLKARWGWNGSLELPVLRPSLLIRSGHYSPYHKGDCWCTYEERTGEPAPFECRQCHSYIGGAEGEVPGKIVFLSDCSHALAGQTLDLPDIDTVCA